MFKIISFAFVSIVGAGGLYVMDQYDPAWKVCKVYDEDASSLFNSEYVYTIGLEQVTKHDEKISFSDKMSDRFESFKTGCEYVYNEGWLFYVGWHIEQFIEKEPTPKEEE